jgi:hypothetical protein
MLEGLVHSRRPELWSSTASLVFPCSLYSETVAAKKSLLRNLPETSMKKLYGFLVLAVFPFLLWAQPPASQKPGALKSLDWMIDSWEVTRWIELPPDQRRTNNSLETVQRKVGGGGLLIEGFHKGKRPGQDGNEEEVTNHNYLSIFLYDDNAKRYRFVAYTARQGSGDYEV